jgi:hypothetical protein
MLRFRKCTGFGVTWSGANDNDAATDGDTSRFEWAATGDVSSSSAMKEEWVEELGESWDGVQGSSNTESTADMGVRISVEHCLI